MVRFSRPAALGLIGAALLVPATSGEAAVSFAAETNVTSTGPAVTVVHLDQQVRVPLQASTRWAWTEGDGTYSGVAIQEVSDRPGSGQALLYVELAAPTGCITEHAQCEPVHFEWIRANGDGSPPSELLLDPGDYWVYSLGDQGSRVQSQIKLGGLSGSVNVSASQPVSATLRSVHIERTALAGYGGGKITERLPGPGLVAVGTWVRPSDAFAIAFDCIEESKKDPDPTGTCGFPVRSAEGGGGFGGGTSFWWPNGGEWSVGYHLLAASPAVEQIGAFGFWLTWASS